MNEKVNTSGLNGSNPNSTKKVSQCDLCNADWFVIFNDRKLCGDCFKQKYFGKVTVINEERL